MKHFIVSVFMLANVTGVVHAQVSFTASSSKVVELGENFRLNFSVNANGSNFAAPDLSAFHVLAGPSTSTSTSFQYINGKTSQSISNTYSYILQAKKEGKFLVGKAEIAVDGKTYYTEPISIEVIKGSGTNIADPKTEITESPVSNDDLFVRINLDKTTVYQGEQIIATLKLYDRQRAVKNISNYKFPSFTGFFSQEIKQASNIQLERENVNGKIYYTGTLRQSIIFPQRSGTLTIDPFELECIVAQKAGQRRNFFGELIDIYRDVNQTIKSLSKTVTVLPLPANAPSSFSGAVGSNFQLTVTVDRTNLKSNESLTLKVNLSGSGNLKIIDKFPIVFPSSFEVFDPKITNNISNTTAGSKGTNSYEYLIIPREAGEYKIPSFEFSYFDVASKSYKILRSEEFGFKIEKGDNSQNQIANQGANQEVVKQLGTDIRFIHQEEFVLKPTKSVFFGTLAFYLSYLVAFLVFVIILIVLRHRIKLSQNIGLVKNRRANRMSQKRLKVALQFLKKGEKQPFYDEVIKALWGYLGDKLNIPVASLSRDTAREALLKFNVHEVDIEDFIKVIDNCEFAKYAPSAGNVQLENDFESARKIINKLEHQLT